MMVLGSHIRGLTFANSSVISITEPSPYLKEGNLVSIYWREDRKVVVKIRLKTPKQFSKRGKWSFLGAKGRSGLRLFLQGFYFGNPESIHPLLSDLPFCGFIEKLICTKWPVLPTLIHDWLCKKKENNICFQEKSVRGGSNSIYEFNIASYWTRSGRESSALKIVCPQQNQLGGVNHIFFETFWWKDNGT